MSKKLIRAAGAVVLRPSPDGPEVLVVHRPRYDDWTLPKGKLDGAETPPAAAVREVAEETGIRIRLAAPLDRTRYRVKGTPKEVDWWLGVIADETATPGEIDADEVDEVFTVPLDFFLKTKPECYRVATKLQIPRGFPFELIPKGEGYNWSSGTYQVCFYCYNGRIIWGITARILKNLAHRLTDNEQRA